MDKFFSKLATAVLAALSLLTATAICGCSNHSAGEQPIIDPAAKRIVKVTAHTPDYCDDTRVTFSPKDGSGYYTHWSKCEKFKIAEFVDDMLGSNRYVETYDFFSDDGKKAYFSFELDLYINGPFSYYIAYPYWAVGDFYDDIIADECSVEFTLPAQQKPLEEGCADTEAILMFAKVEGLEEQPETINATFEHIVSYGLMQLILPDDEEDIEMVSITANKPLASIFQYCWDEDIKHQTFEEISYTITVDVSAISVDDEGILNVWFATLPTDTITEFTVTATTVDNRTYTTTVSVPEEMEFGFEVGRVSKFGVDMIGVQAE